jgi:hypothetical protein
MTRTLSCASQMMTRRWAAGEAGADSQRAIPGTEFALAIDPAHHPHLRQPGPYAPDVEAGAMLIRVVPGQARLVLIPDRRPR